MTTEHPLTGKKSAIAAWVGFLKMVFVVFSLFLVLSGNVEFRESIEIAGLVFPLAILVPLLSRLIYQHETYVSNNRPRTWLFALLDLIGSLAGTAVVTIAALSWFPPVAAVMSLLSLPIAPFTVLNAVIVLFFLPQACYDLVVNQFQRIDQSEDDRGLALPNKPIFSIILPDESCDRIGAAVARSLRPSASS